MPAPHPSARPGPGPGPVTRCRSCGAPIQWWYTPAGAKMPTDAVIARPESVDEAEWARRSLEEWGRRPDIAPNVAAIDGFAVTLGALELAAGDPPATLTPHWATCPDSATWKARR